MLTRHQFALLVTLPLSPLLCANSAVRAGSTQRPTRNHRKRKHFAARRAGGADRSPRQPARLGHSVRHPEDERGETQIQRDRELDKKLLDLPRLRRAALNIALSIR